MIYLDIAGPNEEQQAAKACVMAGVEMWAPKWFSANAVSFVNSMYLPSFSYLSRQFSTRLFFQVHILCNDYDTVCEINKEGTMLNQQLESLVRDGNFKPFIDWTDNYFCETVRKKIQNNFGYFQRVQICRVI